MQAVDFVRGEALWTIGLDDRGHRVVVPCKFVRLEHDGRIAVSCGGVLVKDNNTHEYYKFKEDALRNL